MSLQFEEILTLEKLYLVVITLIVLVVVFTAERIVKRAIRRICRRSELERHVENMLILVSRIVLYSVGITFVLGVWGLPTEWFISVSALISAAVGFASTQTIGNFLAGLYIMMTRPFVVNDYIKIDRAEGEVKEITMNYVKIYTPIYTTIARAPFGWRGEESCCRSSLNLLRSIDCRSERECFSDE